MAKADLTADRLRDLLNYDPETGVFTWRARPASMFSSAQSCAALNSAIAGKVAGHAKARGQITIRVDDVGCYAHRLAWLYVTGMWPTLHIDHIDGDPSNNRFSNLRDVDVATNTQNLHSARPCNESGLLGVTKVKKCAARWCATIHANKKRYYLGIFKSPEEAHEAYLTAKRKLHQGCTI